MSDPFKEQVVTIAFSTKCRTTYKVAVRQSVGAEVARAWGDMEPGHRRNVAPVPHEQGVLFVDLNEVEAINILASKDAVMELLECEPVDK